MSKKVPTRKKLSEADVPAGLAKYPPLPEGWKKSDHYYFYGWVVTHRTLVKHLYKYGGRPPPVGGQMAAMANAMADIRNRSGYNAIFFASGEADEQTIAEGKVTELEWGPTSQLAVIGCNKNPRLFNRRPTPEQMEHLKLLFGGEPRWIRDYETKADFESDLLD